MEVGKLVKSCGFVAGLTSNGMQIRCASPALMSVGMAAMFLLMRSLPTVGMTVA